jgi:hypothetical protein
MDLDQIRHDYQKALRAWHFAWTEREIAHRDHFQPIALRAQGLVYDTVLRELELLREIEERAYDRFLNARAVLSEALRTEEAASG